MINITATGPRGRIVAEDVQAAMQAGTTSASAARAPKSGTFDEISLSDYARALADQLTQQKSSVPHYHLSCEIDLDALLYGTFL